MKKVFELRLLIFLATILIVFGEVFIVNTPTVFATSTPVSIYASGSNICITPGQGLSTNRHFQQMKYTFDPSVHTSWSQVSNSNYWSSGGYGGLGGTNQLEDNTCYTADPTWPHSAYNNYAYYIYFDAWISGQPIYYHTKYFYNDGDIITYNPTTYFSQIKNTTGSMELRDGYGTSTTEIIKTLPQDWVVQVTNTTDASNTPITINGYNWYQVTDPTDNVSGWMVGENASSTVVYLPYNPSQTDTFEDIASNYIATSSRPDIILEAVDHYYNNSSATPSLYSSNEESEYPLSDLNGNFEKKLFLGILARETGSSPYNFNNEIVSYDYGHGISQITPYQVFANEENYGDWQYNSDDTRGIASKIKIELCKSDNSNLYENCYSNGGEHDFTNPKTYIHYGGDSEEPIYKYYTNTKQSIYANIKDGLRILLGKYYINDDITTSTTTPYGTFTAYERKNILTTELYNGNNCGYVNDVASTTEDIDDYFPTATSSDITSLIEKMRIAGNNALCADLQSPGDISIEDSKGRVVGVVNGNYKNDYPLAVYDSNKKIVKILAAENDSYTYKVIGTDSGTYGLKITIKNGNQNIEFKATDIAMLPNEVHAYLIDKEAISKGQEGVTLMVDRNGDGVIERTLKTGLNLTADVYNTGATPEELEAFQKGDVPDKKKTEEKIIKSGPLPYSRDIPEKVPKEPIGTMQFWKTLINQEISE